MSSSAAIFTISPSSSLPASDPRYLRTSSPAPIVLVTPTVFSLQFHRRYLKVDAVDVASGGPPGGTTPRTPLWRTQLKAQAVRLVRQLRAELGTERGTIQRVARQLGYGVESVRAWVRQADIDDGGKPG